MCILLDIVSACSRILLEFIVYQRREESSQIPCLIHVLRLTINLVSRMITEREHIKAREGHDNLSSQALDWRDQFLRPEFGNAAPIYTVYSLDVSIERPKNVSISRSSTSRPV